MSWATPVVLLASLLATGAAGWRLAIEIGCNRTIASLAEGKDVAVADTAPAELLFARAHFLLSRDRIDEALLPAELGARAGAPPVQAALLYDMANARMRQAFSLIEAMQLEKAVQHLRLAKEDYRRALRLDPQLWDARYNLDVVMRMARDFPDIEPAAGDDAPPTASTLWTDLPGLPKGLP
jgi:mxaK protein